MANQEVSKTRVRSMVDDIPKELTQKRLAKVRNTMKRTFSGMGTLLGQLAQNKTDTIRTAKKRKKIKTIIITSVIAIVIAIVVLIIIIAS